MIIDRSLITAAISSLLLENDIAIPLKEEDVNIVCPEPEWAVHVIGRSTSKVCAAIKNEFDGKNINNPHGIILYIRSIILKMNDLEQIDQVLPRTDSIIRGVDFHNPSGGDIEVWVFG